MTVRERYVPGRNGANDVQNEECSSDFQFPLYVMVFAANAKKSTINWIIGLLQKDLNHGGAELLTRESKSLNQEVIVEIDAAPVRLLEAAENMEIIKEDKSGNCREFVFSSVDLFLSPGMDMNDLLSMSEKQRIILNEIMSLHLTDKSSVMDYPNIAVFPGQSIVQVCKDNRIIKHIYPIHDYDELEQLEKKWYSFPVTSQPLDDIRNYFGEAVSFYFAFLGFYTLALIPPALIGLIQAFITLNVTYSYICFSVFKMIWLTLFLESWKRKSNELAFSWGTLKSGSLPKPHPTFRGDALALDPITKQMVPVYPGYKRHLKVYCVSMPIVACCLALAFAIMLVYFEIENYVTELYHETNDFFGWVLVQVPGVAYAILVFIMSKLYGKLAKFLTEWENHKTQESFENHRVAKLLLFEFVNNFVAMFYIAFYLQNFEMLQWQIGIMMVVNQIINQFQEAVLPVVLQKVICMWHVRSKQHSSEPSLNKVLKESELWPYECTYDDYLEIFIQFGYVFLFSSIYPLAAIFALINNVIEIWADAFKLCHSYQRPQAQPVRGIGVWQIAFEILGVLSVMTNCALLCLSPIIVSFAPDVSSSILLFVAVVVEHVIIVMKITLSYLISDVPKWVKVQIQKAQFESLQALKAERKLKTKEMLKFMKEKKIA